jgi:hypothetical protein
MRRGGGPRRGLLPLAILLVVVFLIASSTPLPGRAAPKGSVAPGVRALPVPGTIPIHSRAAAISPPAPTVHLAPPGLSAPEVAPAAPVRPAAGPVNPFLAHSKEPAPMGIADFGVTGPGSGSSSYTYSTTAFQANAAVRSMSISATSGSTTIKVAAFELNAIVEFQQGGANYSYWIQNGLHLDSSSDQFTIGGAYVWNFSSPTARLAVGELKGNSSSVLLTDTYYFIPGCGGFAGQCTTLNLPANLTARIALSTCGAYPCVVYQYNIGVGWVTYDSVSFLHLAGATEIGFVVDGQHYAPLGLGVFYDAEWDWVAAWGGHSGRDDGSNLTMSLDYWSGHRYEPVPSAWNFGGDTGESSYNVTESLVGSEPGGAPSAELNSGAGTLGILYNASTVGTLNITAPVVGPATVSVGGTPVPLQGGSVNLTLVAGTYDYALENYSNASGSVSVAAGNSAFVNLSGAGWTAFAENGLAAGTLWGVALDNLTRTGRGPVLSFNLPNGSYPVEYSPVPGYFRNATDPGSIAVPVVSPVAVGWSPFTYAVTFGETGLPTGTPWWVNASGAVLRGNGASLVVRAVNGSTPFTVGAGYEFLASPDQGTIHVVGGLAPPVSVQFSYREAYISGTLSPATAGLTIGGIPQPVSAGAFNDTVVPGEYVLVANAPGFLTQTISVNTTAGNTTVEQISLTPNGSTPITPSSAPPSMWTPTALLGLGGVVVVIGGAVTYLLLRRQRAAP